MLNVRFEISAHMKCYFLYFGYVCVRAELFTDHIIQTPPHSFYHSVFLFPHYFRIFHGSLAS